MYCLVSSLRATITDLTKQNASLTSSLDDLRSSHDVLASSHTSTSDLVRRHAVEKETLSQLVQQVTAKLETAQQSEREMQDKVSDAELSAEAMQAQVTQLCGEISRQNEEIKQVNIVQDEFAALNVHFVTFADYLLFFCLQCV